MAGQRFFVGLDVSGGTTMKGGVVSEAGQPLSAHAVMDTHPERGQDEGLETMCETIRNCIKAANMKLDDIAAIGVATPGLMDIRGGLILDPPNLKPWKNVPVREHIRRKCLGNRQRFKTMQMRRPTVSFGLVRASRSGAWSCLHWGRGVGGGIIIDDVIIEGEQTQPRWGTRTPAHRYARSRADLRLWRPRVPGSICQLLMWCAELCEGMAAWRGADYPAAVLHRERRCIHGQGGVRSCREWR